MVDQAERKQRMGGAVGQLFALLVGFAAGLVRWAGLIVVVILVLRVLLTVGGANPANGITTFIDSWSDPLCWRFKDLFTPGDAKLRVLVNYGIAAIFWLTVSSLLARLIRRAG